MNIVNSNTQVTATEYVVVDFMPHVEVTFGNGKRAEINRAGLRFDYDFTTNEWRLRRWGGGTAHGRFIKKDGNPGVPRKFYLYDMPVEVFRQWAEEFKPVHTFTLNRVG